MQHVLGLLLAQGAPSLGDIAAGADKGFGWVGSLVVTLIVVVVIAGLLRTAASRYKKVPPEKALVVYGGGTTRIVTGGAVLVIPVLRSTYDLDLTAFQVELALENVPNADRIPITVHANATCRISNKESLLQNAARTFGQKGNQQNYVAETVKNALEGHLRIILGQMNMDDLLSKRDEFNKKVSTEAEGELNKLGCEIDILNIKSVNDAHGYIEALGKPKSAQVKAEAAIKEAEATRDREKQVSDAVRDAETTKATNAQKVAEAQRQLSLTQASISSEVNAANARAAQQGPLAEAQASMGVRVAQVEAEEAETEARIKLQSAVARKTEAELNATRIKQAEATANALKIEADGMKNKALIEAEASGQARNITAEAAATASQKEAEGEAAKIRMIGQAQAEMTSVTGKAQADATQAKLEAEAAGQEAQAKALKAKLLAEAEGAIAMANAERAKLLAQAEGAQKLNEAFTTLTTSEARKLFMTLKVMENMPAILTAAGTAGQKIMEPVAQALVSSLGSINSVTVYDTGNGNGQGGALERVASLGPDTLFRLFQNLKASGLFPVINAAAIQHLGIDLNAAGQTIEAEATVMNGSPAGGGNGEITATKKQPTAAK